MAVNETEKNSGCQTLFTKLSWHVYEGHFFLDTVYNMLMVLNVMSRKMKDWHIAYVLTALNPVFLIVNILIASLEVCSASVAAAGTNDFCVNVMDFLSATSLSTSPLSTTTTPLPRSTSSMEPCNIVHSVLDLDTNSTVTYTINMCTTTPLTTTTLARAAYRFDWLLTYYYYGII